MHIRMILLVGRLHYWRREALFYQKMAPESFAPLTEHGDTSNKGVSRMRETLELLAIMYILKEGTELLQQFCLRIGFEALKAEV